jgi:hypothetical protein
MIPLPKLNSLFGRGQVVASAGMYGSMLNGAFRKWLVYVVVVPSGNVTVSGLQSGCFDRVFAGNAGLALPAKSVLRLTSSCLRQVYGTPV